MLVIVSDLHLTDGTTGASISPGAFRLFRERLEGMAYDASKREDKYQPIEELDLVLLGDIFDLIRSTAWTEQKPSDPGFARPWSDPSSKALMDKIDEITAGIIQKNSEALEVMRTLADGTGISLPPPTKTGQVDRRVSRDHRSKSRLPVRVNIHYMIGNHDWFYHLPGRGYDQIRTKVKAAMGLSNPPTPFPHQADESTRIARAFQQQRVYARHGDIYDPYNYVQDHGRNFPSIGDALVIDLFNPFPDLVHQELGDRLPEGFYSDLKEMGNIRPSYKTPIWITSKLRQHQVADIFLEGVGQVWDQAVDRFLDIEFLKVLDKWLKFDPVDVVETLMRLTTPLSMKAIADLIPWAEKVAGVFKATFQRGALEFEACAAREAAYESQAAQFIVYGHTHGYKVHPLRSVEKNGKRFDQLYINSGTWKALHEQGNHEPYKDSFVSYKTMTMLGFYRDDERKGRSFETWTGTLEV